MPKNRYRLKEQYKKQYTFTKTKAVIGFFLSALFSVFFSNYFERHGAMIFDQGIKALKTTFTAEATYE